MMCANGTRPWRAAFLKACKFLEHCSNNGITFNPEKFVFARDKVEYVGFEITMASVVPLPSHKETRGEA